VYLLVLFLAALAAGCQPGKESEQKDVAIQINESKISLEEFNDLIKFEAYVDPQMNLTAEDRDRFIEYLIRKELLIQEAARLKLDRKPDFVRTIEKYWESTLIRNLLDLKSAELRKKVLITADEVKAYYARHQSEFDQPFEAVKGEIKKTLESERLEKKLEEWTRKLRKSADIKVNRPLINGDEQVRPE
jgi:hypothetical protein